MARYVGTRPPEKYMVIIIRILIAFFHNTFFLVRKYAPREVNVRLNFNEERIAVSCPDFLGTKYNFICLPAEACRLYHNSSVLYKFQRIAERYKYLV